MTAGQAGDHILRRSTRIPLRSRHAAQAGAALLLLSVACGGGGSPSGSSYPSIMGAYGAYAGFPLGSTTQRWTAPDGTVTTRQCVAVTSIEQNGAQFTGSVDRTAPCNARGGFRGTIAMDGTFHFTLTQDRWESCTASGPVEYSGGVSMGNLFASGRVAVRCDDGRTMTIDETISGSLPTPPSPPGNPTPLGRQ